MVRSIELTERQQKIIEIVKKQGPITGEQIAEKFNLTRATLRPDLAILTMAGILDARPRVGYYYKGKTIDVLFSEKMRDFIVNDIKSVPIVVRENSSIYDGVVTMFLEDVGTLFVVQEGGLLTGIVSRKDLLKAAIGHADINQVPIELAMTRMPNIITVMPDETVYEAARKIIEHEVDALPVVRLDESHQGLQVIGRITKTNITKLFVELAEKE